MLAGYLHTQAAELLRALRQHHETAGSADTAAEAAEAVRQLRRSARRISGSLYTFQPLLDAEWADRLGAELDWLSGVLALEHACAARLERLLGALRRLSAPAPQPGARTEERPGIGAARAGALLERRLNLSRTRAHSAALQALGSARFHAVADAVAVLASEAPLDPAVTDRPAVPVLGPAAEQARHRLAEAVEALPCDPGALDHTLTSGESRDDAAWHRVRRLARLARYAQEVLGEDPSRLAAAGHHLDRYRDAAEAAAAAAAAGHTPRIAPATAYALGVLHADQRHAVDLARRAFCRSWHPRREARHD
ncbi:CHAD domain-containing protein [Streptomyces sp. 549]|uniref:CHAD domain-containing protein n=1 Tax=Streptomyces sp. 549 TaxID=3049076 RepID=UPI0024C29AF5|nr:CHAD domain-containing protein [Streptomyces sp. 549]MDK1472392.1 CHAD domain-containing protein [Streptomyces sp. 549]